MSDHSKSMTSTSTNSTILEIKVFKATMIYHFSHCYSLVLWKLFEFDLDVNSDFVFSSALVFKNYIGIHKFF